MLYESSLDIWSARLRVPGGPQLASLVFLLDCSRHTFYSAFWNDLSALFGPVNSGSEPPNGDDEGCVQAALNADIHQSILNSPAEWYWPTGGVWTTRTSVTDQTGPL